MPDWSYRTLFRPLLFALPPAWGRAVALRSIGRLARMPLGGQVIDLLGHMRPPVELQREVLGRVLSAPLGIAAELDPSGFALVGLARFGVGFVVIGPITGETGSAANVARDDPRQAIVVDERYTNIPHAQALERLAEFPRECCAIVRLHGDAQGAAVASRLSQSPGVAALALEEVAILGTFPAALPLLLVLRADASADTAMAQLEQAQQHWPRCDGVLVMGAVQQDRQLVVGAPAREPALALVGALRTHQPRDLVIIAAGGCHEPAHALDFFSAGADLVQIDTGLIFSGPGLIKRTNEALLAREASKASVSNDTAPAPQLAWFWLWLMGLAMFFGGALALAIAGTRVVLPYDEQFVGMTYAELDALNPRLLPFMAHDRATLAGTMLALGVLYSGLGLHAVRRGFHWAWVAIIASAVTGFLSFFLFLGFGYFEPFHAFVSTALLQLLVLGWHAPLGKRHDAREVPLVEDWRWRCCQWGQLLLVSESIAVIVGGVAISCVGATTVFVAEDLEYMRTCAADLAAANPRLIALVAHDRATFGGMLISCGLTTLLATLWGFGAGRRWLFTTLLYAGAVGYGCTIVVHFLVGYVDFFHLLPAYAGLLLHLLALGLAAPYLLWQRYLPA